MKWSGPEVDDFYAVVGSRIKDARTRARLTQIGLAKALGITRSSIANIEAGRQRVQLHGLVQIAEQVDSELTDLIPNSPRGQVRHVDADDLEGLPGTTADFVNAVTRRLEPKQAR